MTKIKRLKSNKLFFGKWPFKLECRIKGANKITNLGLEKARDWCLGKFELKYNSNKQTYDKKDLLKFIDTLEPFLKDEVQVRAESNHFNIFCKHQVLLDNLVKAAEPWAYAIHSPETQEEIDFLLDNKNQKILCNALPRGEYKYKIVLRERMKLDSREKFFTWLNKYGDSIHYSRSTEHWFTGKSIWKQDPFFYVKDNSLMTMIMLYAANDIRKVHEYVLRNQITEE